MKRLASVLATRQEILLDTSRNRDCWLAFDDRTFCGSEERADPVGVWFNEFGAVMDLIEQLEER